MASASSGSRDSDCAEEAVRGLVGLFECYVEDKSRKRKVGRDLRPAYSLAARLNSTDCGPLTCLEASSNSMETSRPALS